MSSSGRVAGRRSVRTALAAVMAASLALAAPARAGVEQAGAGGAADAGPSRAPDGGAPAKVSPYAKYARAGRDRATGHPPRRMLRLSVRGAQKTGR